MNEYDGDDDDDDDNYDDDDDDNGSLHSIHHEIVDLTENDGDYY